MAQVATSSGYELASGPAKALVLPELGGGLGGVWLGERTVLRPWSGNVEEGPFALSNNILAPFCNRVSRPFSWAGQEVSFKRNMESEAYPIHGDAFQKAWEVEEQSEGRIVLTLRDGEAGPLLYTARLTYALSSGGFHSELTLTSRAAGPLPFGLGFHPWFPRNAGTRLHFPASGVWMSNAEHLPSGEGPDAVPADWNFAKGTTLPDGLIDNAFEDWGGTAQFEQGPGAVPLTLKASGNLTRLHVYSPAADADFFCAEPVAHPVDAFNLPGMPGLQVLEPGESLTGWMDLSWEG